jgi:hypothetical protein
MSRIRIIGLALVAVFAMSVVTSATASAALPEFETSGVCEKGPVAKKWHFETSACTTVSAGNTGEFGQTTFTATSGTGKLVTKAGRTIECTSDSNWGELSEPKSDRVRVTFSGCKSATFGVACNTAGAASGVIETKPLKSTLVYINEKVTPKTVGDLLEPESGNFAEIKCSLEEIIVKGSVIGKIPAENAGKEKQINVKRTKVEIVFAQTGGVQNPTEYESGGVKVKPPTMGSEGKGLEPFAFEQSAEETIDNLTLTKTNELKA